MGKILAILAGLLILSKLREQSGGFLLKSTAGYGVDRLPYGGAPPENSPFGDPVFFGQPGSGGPGSLAPAPPRSGSGTLPSRTLFGGTPTSRPSIGPTHIL